MVRAVRWMWFATLLVNTTLLGAQSPDAAQLHAAVRGSNGRVILTLRNGRNPSLRAPGQPPVDAPTMNAIEQRLTRQFALKVHGRAGIISAIFTTVSDSDLDRILADSNVAEVIPDRLGAPAGASPSFGRSQTTPWGIVTVGAPQAWAAGLTGAGVRVGVIDGGIDYTHPDLNVVGGYDFTTSNGAASAYNDNVVSCGGHGTHIAGTIGARQDAAGVVGVAPDVALYALKVFQDMGGSCLAWESDQIAALNWAATNNIRVVNISIGNTSYNPAYQAAITNVIAMGVTVVAAAGNSSGGPLSYPGAYAGVIGVGALDAGNAPAGYESVGPQMWISAPGTGILSTMPGGGTGTKSGTSMATPHVVGVAALMLQAHPAWGAAEISASLKATAVDIGSPGFDNYTGWGLAQAPTSGGSGTIPTTLALSPGARSATVAQGGAAPSDNGSVTLSGTTAGTTAWSATKKKSWTTLTTASGIGSGSVAWTRNTAGLAVGTYVDTITVTATGITGSPAILIDTLTITPAFVATTIAVLPSGRHVSVQQGATAPGDNAAVTLGGTNGAITAWTATKKKSWTTFTTAGGTGSGTVSWSRNAGGLAPGNYVDTITVAAGGTTGSPAMVFDTLTVVAAPPPPLSIAVSPAGRRATVAPGGAAPGDNASVTLAGSNAASTTWTATKKKAWTTLTTSAGTGSGTMTWSRNATGLAPGNYIDTITVAAGAAVGSPTTVIDTLTISASQVTAVALTLSPASRSVTVTQGAQAPGDNVTVILTGTEAGATGWSATTTQPRLTLTSAAGTGTGIVSWTRNALGLAAGVYVDTIKVASPGVAGSPWSIYDTLRITATPVPVTIAATPGGRSTAITQGAAAPSDSAAVTLSGTGASSTVWSATHRQSWISLLNASGTGNGTVAWARNPGGLGVGTYVDTITIAAAGTSGSPAYVFDTLRVNAALVPVTIAVSPAAHRVSIAQGAAAPADSATVQLAGTGAVNTSWQSARTATWATLTVPTGTGAGMLAWTRNTANLVAGVYVDTIIVSVPNSGAQAWLFDSLVVTASPVIAELATSPGGRHSRVMSVSGFTASVAVDSVVVHSTTGAETLQWAAATTAPWISLVANQGATPSTLSWSRNLVGLAPGLHVDSIVVTVAAAPQARTVVMDTLEIVAVTLPGVEAAAQDLFTAGQISTEQREALDQLGNHNGKYDVGDFLAWIHRANITVSAALTSRLMAIPSGKPAGTTPR